MSRLTERDKDCCQTCRNKGWCNMDEVCSKYRLYEKLAHYEDLADEGRLIELPCKVGSNVYAIGMNGEIIAFAVDTIGYALNIASQIGKGFYLTKAEAEAKLAELKEGGSDE